MFNFNNNFNNELKCTFSIVLKRLKIQCRYKTISATLKNSGLSVAKLKRKSLEYEVNIL